MMAAKHEDLKCLITNAIVELCRKEAFYFEELRIEGTVCLVSDRSSVLIAQITEQIGEQCVESVEGNIKLPILNSQQAINIAKDEDQQEKRCGNKRSYEQCIWSEPEESNKEGGDVEKNKILCTRPKYLCSFCPDVFELKGDLRSHLNNHLGANPHNCEHCDVTFRDFDSLRSHIERQHLIQGTRQWLCKEDIKDCSKKQVSVEHIHLDKDTTKENHENKDLMLTSSKHNSVNDVETNIAIPSKVEDGTTNTGQPVTDSMTEIVQTFIKMLEGQQEIKQRAAFEVQRQEEKKRDQFTIKRESNIILGQNEQCINMGPKQSPDLSLASVSSPTGMITSTTFSPPTLHQLSPSLGMWPAITLGFPSPQLMAQAQQESLQNLIQQTSSPQQQAHPSPQSLLQQVTSQPSPLLQVNQPHHSQLLAQQNIAASSTLPLSPRQVHKSDPPVDIQRSSSGKFLCPYCDKTYNFKHTLKDHINKHMGKRPHVCKHCGDAFTHLASLCAHIKRRHDNEMPDDYRCEICHEKFMNLQSLKQHFTWRHKEVKFTHSMLIVAKPDSSQAGPSHDQSDG